MKYIAILFSVIVVFTLLMWQYISPSLDLQKIFMYRVEHGNDKRIENLKRNFGLILLWTKTYFIKVNKSHVQCGIYDCKITKDRRLLPESDIIVLNARFAKGKVMILLQRVDN